MRKKRNEKGPGMLPAFALTLCLALGGALAGSPVKVSAEEYTYQVTFYSGNQGSFDGTEGLSVNNQSSGSEYTVEETADAITVSGLKRGDIVSFDVQAGAVELSQDSKYYLRGVRESGRDNNTVDSSAFRVDGDVEYVVAYGIRGNQTEYTVNYRDAEGNELAPSRTYYGNVGDKPVVAYLYLENYNPQTLALTKTLSDNEAENVFTFVYTQVPTEVITEPGQTITNTTTVTETVPGATSETGNGSNADGTSGAGAGTTGSTGTNGTGTTGTGTAGTGTAGTGTGQTANTGTDTTGAGTAGTGTTDSATDETGTDGTAETGTDETGADTEEDTTQIEDEDVPQEDQDLTDLDEEDVPQSNLDIDGEEVQKGLPMVAGAAIAVLAVAALGVIVFIVRKRMK